MTLFLVNKYLIIYLTIHTIFTLSNQSNDEELYDCVCPSDLMNKSAIYLKEKMSKYMLPAIVVGVSRKGFTVWEEAFGLADIENNVLTQNHSVFRIASISKALTSALIGHLIDKGLIDLHESIHKYLSPNVFPIKQWRGKNVTITLNQLMSHSSGLRVSKLYDDYRTIYYFKNVTDSLKQFKDEPLISEPGTQYNYSNFGFQVVGAVIEAVLNESFDKTINQMFKHFSMNSTFCETNEMLVKNRAHDYINSDSEFLSQNNNIYYTNKSEVKILKAMIMDDLLAIEAQWPSGAIMSTASDLLTFGNHLLNRYRAQNNTDFDYLTPDAVHQIWSPVIEKYKNKFGSNKNAHGWAITELDRPITCSGHCQLPHKISKIIWKAGQLTGTSSIILILPEQEIIVTILSNNSNFSDIFEAALIVAKNFMN